MPSGPNAVVPARKHRGTLRCPTPTASSSASPPASPATCSRRAQPYWRVASGWCRPPGRIRSSTATSTEGGARPGPCTCVPASSRLERSKEGPPCRASIPRQLRRGGDRRAHGEDGHRIVETLQLSAPRRFEHERGFLHRVPDPGVDEDFARDGELGQAGRQVHDLAVVIALPGHDLPDPETTPR